MTDTPAAALAVVIVNYNTGEWLDALPAIAWTTCRGELAVDVLVIDNDSRDGQRRRGASRRVPGARLVRNPTNRYLSPAWNQGARAHRRAVPVVPEPRHRVVRRGTLADLVRVARAHPRAGIVGPMVRNPDGTVYASGRRFPSVVDAAGPRVRLAVHAGTTRSPGGTRWTAGTARPSARSTGSSGCCMLIPRAAFDAVGGFDEGFPLYAEELDIATRLRDAGLGGRVHARGRDHCMRSGSRPAGDRRPHRLVVMHSSSLYRYYARHRAHAAGVA